MFGFGLQFEEEALSKRDVNAAIRKRSRGKGGLFGFGLKREEKEAIIKGAITDVVIEKLFKMLTPITYELGVAHGLSDDEAKANPLLERQAKLAGAFELVRMGYDPDGPDRISDPISQGGAKVADTACYMAIMSGKFDGQHVAGELRHLLGFSRDGSEGCQSEST
jgi:hypothetical protein